MTALNDGYRKFFNLFYKSSLSQNTPKLKADITATNTAGVIGFNYIFYSDSQFTQYDSESAVFTIANGANAIEIDNPQNLYAIGRLSLVSGSSLGITSLKINDVEHVTSGTMVVNAQPLSFSQTSYKSLYFISCPLNKVTDSQFNVDFQIENLGGSIVFEYLYYTDETYTTLSYITTKPIANGQNVIPLEYTNFYVVIRFKMAYNSDLNVTSFKLKGAEQLTTTMIYHSPNVESDICFPSGTFVKTDQGKIEIQKLNPFKHTLNMQRIVAVTETYSLDKCLVCIEKDSLRKNYPTERTLISKKHKVYLNGKMKAASQLVGKHKGVSYVPYHGERLYNVLLEDWGVMNVHGMLCETLHPTNPICKMFV
jgi:hypothetical protein